MSIPGLPTPFALVAYADTVCSIASWTAATDTEKYNALQYATVYISKNYYLNFSTTDVPESVQTGTSLLAEQHLLSDIFTASTVDQAEKGLIGKTVDADGVKVDKKWDAYKSQSFVDPFPTITAILALDGYCRLNAGGIKTVSLMRR